MKLLGLFEHHGGLHLKDSVLWFDAGEPRPLCFVSSACVPGASRHQKILATDGTARLLRAAGAAHGRGRRAHEPQALVSPYGRPFSLGALGLELFPSGYVHGSASLLVTVNETTIVYAGHVNPRRNPLVERLEARACDLLVLPSPLGRRRYVLPPQDQATDALLRFVRDALARRACPVLFCSPIGEAQQVIAALHAAEIPCVAHRQVVAACRVYGEAGAPLGPLRGLSGSPRPGEALVWPLALRHSPTVRRLTPLRTAFVSGLALDEESRARAGCDAAIALSSHADHPALLEYVQACAPKQIILTQTNPEIAGDLRALGIEVSSIGPPEQMALF